MPPAADGTPTSLVTADAPIEPAATAPLTDVSSGAPAGETSAVDITHNTAILTPAEDPSIDPVAGAVGTMIPTLAANPPSPDAADVAPIHGADQDAGHVPAQLPESDRESGELEAEAGNGGSGGGVESHASELGGGVEAAENGHSNGKIRSKERHKEKCVRLTMTAAALPLSVQSGSLYHHPYPRWGTVRGL